MTPPFKLYQEERHWWSFADYGAVMDVMTRLKPKRVLEFGPGSSTLALIEGGAMRIDTCEDHPSWLAVYRERLEAVYPDIVMVYEYAWSDPLTVPRIARRRYDLALIDGPYTSEKRPPAIAYALQRSKAVLVPTEDGREHTSLLRPHIVRLAERFGFNIEWMDTGPLAGGFALMTREEP
jgi:hypothetical protein